MHTQKHTCKRSHKINGEAVTFLHWKSSQSSRQVTLPPSRKGTEITRSSQSQATQPHQAHRLPPLSNSAWLAPACWGHSGRQHPPPQRPHVPARPARTHLGSDCRRRRKARSTRAAGSGAERGAEPCGCAGTGDRQESGPGTAGSQTSRQPPPPAGPFPAPRHGALTVGSSGSRPLTPPALSLAEPQGLGRAGLGARGGYTGGAGHAARAGGADAGGRGGPGEPRRAARIGSATRSPRRGSRLYRVIVPSDARAFRSLRPEPLHIASASPFAGSVTAPEPPHPGVSH